VKTDAPNLECALASFIGKGSTLAGLSRILEFASLRGAPFLTASPERALTDKVNDERSTALTTRRQMKSCLLGRLRIAPQRLLGLDVQNSTASLSTTDPRNCGF
jgi:hypothetical protein